MTLAMTQNWANPSALYSFGIDAAKELRVSRQQVAAAMGAEPDRVFFTSGGTEADNWAIFGTVKRFGKRGKHIITTAIEHHAVLNCMKELEAQGYEVTYLQPDSMGCVTAQQLKAAYDADPVDGWARYHALCASGGSKLYAETLAAAGLELPYAPGVVERLARELAAQA